jgi:hypothetical protein
MLTPPIDQPALQGYGSAVSLAGCNPSICATPIKGVKESQENKISADRTFSRRETLRVGKAYPKDKRLRLAQTQSLKGTVICS